MKKLLFAPFAALLVAFSANAGEIQTLRLQEQPYHDGIIEVSGHRAPASVILTDAVYGGVAGLAIGGGVALITQDGNWGRDLAVGAGIGLLVGGIFGAVDAASMADMRPMPDGFGSAAPVAAGRF